MSMIGNYIRVSMAQLAELGIATDPHDLTRFLQAQDRTYEQAPSVVTLARALPVAKSGWGTETGSLGRFPGRQHLRGTCHRGEQGSPGCD